MQLGSCDQLKGSYTRALYYLFKAADLYTALKDKYGLSKCYTAMGVIYWYQNLHSKALEYFEKNIEISIAMKDTSGMASSYGNMAIIFDDMGDLEKSLLYYNKALKIFRAENNLHQVASCLDNISIIYMQQKDFANALKFNEEGFNIRKSQSDTLNMMISMENLANIFIRQGKFDKAIDISNQVLVLAKRTRTAEDFRYAYANLKQAYKGKGDYRSAYEVQEKLLRLKDSLRDSENIGKVAELEAKFKNKEKETELTEMKFNQKLKEKENQEKHKQKNILITCALIGFVLFLFIAFLLLKRYKEKNKVAEELEKKNTAIEIQKKIIDIAYSELSEKNKDITDSIRYAKRIQEAIFPSPEYFKKSLPEAFALFIPKDIVSGDFYWIDNMGDDVYLAVVDCTGHGVPGAFMSIVGCNLLNNALHEHKCQTPAEILNRVNQDLNETLRQTVEESKVKDGMEITLCRWNKKTNSIEFALANHVMYQISNGELIAHTGDKHPIGAFYGEELKPFKNISPKVSKGDVFYLCSDGFADQFGGPKGKKFKYKQLEERFLAYSSLPLPQQKEKLLEDFLNWKSDLEQVDDVCVIGLKI